METIETMIVFFLEGGAFMHPSALILALGTAVAIERYFSLSSAQPANRKTWNQPAPRPKKGDVLPQSLRSMHDTAFKSIDRDVFRRQIEYHTQLNREAAAP